MANPVFSADHFHNEDAAFAYVALEGGEERFGFAIPFLEAFFLEFFLLPDLVRLLLRQQE